jgi:hypothetical protein
VHWRREIKELLSMETPIDRSSKQKFNKEILELNHTIHQMDLADVYRTFHPTSAQYILLKSPWNLLQN